MNYEKLYQASDRCQSGKVCRRPSVKTMLCGGPSEIAVSGDDANKFVEQFIRLDISVDVHDVIEQ